MSSLYPLTKADVTLEIKGSLQDGGTDILNFILSEMYTGQNPEYENVGRHFSDKIPILKRLLQYGLLFDTHERGVRDVFLSFPGFLFTDDFEANEEHLEKIFSLIIEKFKEVGSKVEFTSQDLEKSAFDSVVDDKRHKAVIMFLNLLGKGTPGGHVISISKQTSDGLTIRAYIDILERGSFKRYISTCIENFNKSLESKLIDEAIVTMAEVSQLIMEIFGQLGVKAGQGLPIQVIASRIDLEHNEDMPWGIKDLIESGYLEGKDGDLKFLLLTTKGVDYLRRIRTKSHQERNMLNANQAGVVSNTGSNKSDLNKIEEVEDKIPKVFISYSHDNLEHKRWVGEFASKLVKNGIDVILDQWDLSFGDDLVKFMEKSLTRADRVLVICTEPYVRKADDGKGGVGYEAMIVTGELVRDLGTSKFIPIIRQPTGEVALPKFLSTRFYVDLKDGPTFDDEYENLLRELHKTPILVKPLLGRNPFKNKIPQESVEVSLVKIPVTRQPSGAEIPVEEVLADPIPDISKINDDLEAIYETALNIARKGDIVAWRKVIKQAKQFVPDKLNAWRKIQDQNVPKTKEEQANVAIGGISPYAPLFAIALAGVESGREKFNNQIAVLDEALNPPNWNKAGYVILADFPETNAYVYHLLHGAVCLLTDQIDIAVAFARSKIRERRIENSIPVLYNHTLTGWPTGLGGDCKIAWGFIRVLPEKWNWLYRIFGDLQDYQNSLCAYYLLLNVLEFVGIVASGNEQALLQEKNITLHVPLTFFQENDETLRKGYQLLINDPSKLRSVWKEYNLDEKKLKDLWPRWLHHMEKWLNSIYFFGPGGFVHKNLFSDLSR